MSYDASYNSPLVINFNSKDRIAGTNSNFISLPVDLGLNKFDSVCLIQASIPKSYYNVPTNYNSFTLREQDDIGFETFTIITLPVGNYNKINLASKLSSLLTANQTMGGTYTVTNPSSTEPDTFKFTFTVTGSSATYVSLNFDDTSPFRQMGFEANSSNLILGVGSDSQSTNAINLAFILRAFIKTNLVQNATDSILEEILSIGSYPTSSLVYFEQQDIQFNTREYNSTSINSWNFVIVDALDNEIDLNGISWAFSVVFYKRNTTHELHKQELQIQNEMRIFQIEQEQNKLQEQFKPTDKLITINGIQLNDTRNPLEPTFPVFPFTAGLSYLNEPEIQFPK